MSKQLLLIKIFTFSLMILWVILKWIPIEKFHGANHGDEEEVCE